MRHAAGQVADGLELLRLPQLRLQALALGEVAGDAVDARRRPRALDQPEADLDLGLVALRSTNLEHQRRRRRFVLQTGHHVHQVRPLSRRDQLFEP